MIDDTGSDHQDLAAEAEHEAEDLKRQGDKLDDDIQATKADWESKQEDQSVPGAVPDPGEGGDPALSVQSEHGESAKDAGQ
ncbi:MAG: hypothetical protein H0U25_07165 [Thermoleophilaceae bacterium]|nr:hypothetical protein [Thermoleophilaceae bacterium]